MKCPSFILPSKLLSNSRQGKTGTGKGRGHRDNDHFTAMLIIKQQENLVWILVSMILEAYSVHVTITTYGRNTNKTCTLIFLFLFFFSRITGRDYSMNFHACNVKSVSQVPLCTINMNITLEESLADLPASYVTLP